MSVAILRGSAVALVLVAVAAIALLFAPWHVIREHAIDPALVGAAIYVGPDYRVSPEHRADMLERGLDAGVTEHVCRGIDHVGPPTMIALCVLVVLAVVVLATIGRRANIFVAIATLLAALVAPALAVYGSFLRHLLEDIGPELPASILFVMAQLMCIAFAAVCVAARRRRRNI